MDQIEKLQILIDRLGFFTRGLNQNQSMFESLELQRISEGVTKIRVEFIQKALAIDPELRIILGNIKYAVDTIDEPVTDSKDIKEKEPSVKEVPLKKKYRGYKSLIRNIATNQRELKLSAVRAAFIDKFGKVPEGEQLNVMVLEALPSTWSYDSVRMAYICHWGSSKPLSEEEFKEIKAPLDYTPDQILSNPKLIDFIEAVSHKASIILCDNVTCYDLGMKHRFFRLQPKSPPENFMGLLKLDIEQHKPEGIAFVIENRGQMVKQMILEFDKIL